jgi:hypothetical protein
LLLVLFVGEKEGKEEGERKTSYKSGKEGI